MDAAEPGSDWRTDTAERAAPRHAAAPDERPAPPPTVAIPGRVPPAAVTPPPPPRYPLYADELDFSGETHSAPESAEPAASILTFDEEAGAEFDEEYDENYDWPERRSWVGWLAALVALAVLAAGAYAVWAFVLDEDEAPSGSQATDSPAETSDGPTPVDVAQQATAEAPETAPPSEDVDGDLVAYDASNMLDGVTETAWRTEGDATGMRLTFTLAAPTRLTEVGILNGYAKKATDRQGRALDWYRGHRKVEAVVWQLGKGTKVRQELGSDRTVQFMDIKPVTTRKVVLRLVQVSAPGPGRASRDYTAISEISLVGLPG